MNKEEMLNRLYEDYRATKDGWGEQIENLSAALRTSKAAQFNLEKMKSELSALEADVVLEGEIASGHAEDLGSAATGEHEGEDNGAVAQALRAVGKHREQAAHLLGG